jgi:hypothetical protein
MPVCLLKFLYSPRHQRTLAEAIVSCVFHVLNNKIPSKYQSIVLNESAMILRREKMKPYKFQRMIDEQPTGGLNYGSIESIRKGVEEIPKYKMGVIPSITTIKRARKELEIHTAEDYGLMIIEESMIHGLVFTFPLHKLIRLVRRAFGLEQFTVTGSNAIPVLLCYTMDGAQLTNFFE